MKIDQPIRSAHQNRVDRFMVLAKQDVPEKPMIPSGAVRQLRARLILEEAFETVQALGVGVLVKHTIAGSESVQFDELRFVDVGDCDIVEVADGCADIKVVTTGTLTAFGISDDSLQRLVDGNNLAKFGPGGRRDEGGKWIKPPDPKPPAIAQCLRDQGWKE